MTALFVSETHDMIAARCDRRTIDFATFRKREKELEEDGKFSMFSFDDDEFAASASGKGIDIRRAEMTKVSYTLARLRRRNAA